MKTLIHEIGVLDKQGNRHPVNFKKGLCSVVIYPCDGAYFAKINVVYFEANDLVVIKFISFEFRKHRKR